MSKVYVPGLALHNSVLRQIKREGINPDDYWDRWEGFKQLNARYNMLAYGSPRPFKQTHPQGILP